MIEINLLPHRKARRIADLRQSAALLILGLVLILGGIFFVERDTKTKLREAQTSVRQLQAAIEQFKPQQARVAKFKTTRSELESKLDVINGLDSARTGPVRLFDEIATLIPDRLWLKKLRTTDGEVWMQGESIDTGIVADFLRNLNGSKRFVNVDLQSTKGGKTVDGVRLVDFKIIAEFENNGSKPEEG
jgi:type IV pilus assembly protein PilN